LIGSGDRACDALKLIDSFDGAVSSKFVPERVGHSMPSALVLPRTTAVAASRSGCDQAADRAAYEATLREELPPSRLPLERFLADGGWPSDIVVRVASVSAVDATLRLTLNVTFDELVTACGGTPDARPRLAEFTLVIDRATTAATFDV
jgi:hypothetical protein